MAEKTNPPLHNTDGDKRPINPITIARQKYEAERQARSVEMKYVDPWQGLPADQWHGVLRSKPKRRTG